MVEWNLEEEKIWDLKVFERFYENEIVMVSKCSERMNRSRWKLERRSLKGKRGFNSDFCMFKVQGKLHDLVVSTMGFENGLLHF